MALPLRIFEERYKAMVRELLETGGRFGVLLIREGQEVGGDATPYDVGVIAHIEQWAELEEGRFALAARGTQRFRLLEMLPPRPYPFGEVEIIQDDRPAASEQLARAMETVRTTFPVYFRMALSLTDQWARGMQLPAEPHALVDFLGPWLQVSEQTKQRLLEIEPATQRVAELASILDELLSRTREEVNEYRRGKYFGLGSQN
jgi:Lon protease-like protein